MESILLTDAVLNNGTVVSEAQLTNISPMSVTDAVSNNGTAVRERQL